MENPEDKFWFKYIFYSHPDLRCCIKGYSLQNNDPYNFETAYFILK